MFHQPILRMLRYIGYFLCFAVPGIALSIVFPRYASLIIFADIFLIITSTSFVIGIHWDSLELSSGTQFALRVILPIFLLWPIARALMSALTKHDYHSVITAMLDTAWISIRIYLPYFLGRAISRRRRAKNSDLTSPYASQQPPD